MENEKSFRQEEIDKENVRVVAVLNDLSGNKYFLQSDSGKYVWLDSDLGSYKEVDEQIMFSSMVKHGYKAVENSEPFIFGKRRQYLS